MNESIIPDFTLMTCISELEEAAERCGIGGGKILSVLGIIQTAVVFALGMLLIYLIFAAYIMLSGFSMKARKAFIGNSNYDAAVLDKNSQDLKILFGETVSENPDTHEVTEHYSFETDVNRRVTKVSLGKDFHETIAIYYIAIYITLMCQVPYLLTSQGFTVSRAGDGLYLCQRDDIALKISGENGLVTFIELSRREGR